MSKIGTYKLGGLVLSGPGSYGWEFRPGPDPVVKTFIVSKDTALELEGKINKRVKFEALGVPGRRDLVVDYLYIREVGPGPDPFTRRVVVADCRVWFNDVWIKLDINIRRRTGETIVYGDELVQRQILNDLDYKPQTLNFNKPFTPQAALFNVLLQATKVFSVAKGSKIPTDMPQIEIENLRTDMLATDALSVILNQLPGFNMWVDKTGVIRVYDVFAQSSIERTGLSSGLVPHKRFGRLEKVNRELLRPSSMIALMDEEIELRFDGVSAPSVSDDDTALSMSNVIPCPVDRLIIPGGAGGANRIVGLGTWLEYDVFLEAIQNTLNGPLPVALATGAVPKLTVEVLAANYASSFKYLYNNYVLGAGGVNDSRWETYIRTIQATFRRYWKVNVFWRDRLDFLQAFRVIRISQELGEANRVKSPVYANNITRPSDHALSILRLDVQRRRQHPFVTDDSYRGEDEPFGDAPKAPVDIEQIDGDSMVFRLVDAADYSGESRGVILGTAVGLLKGVGTRNIQVIRKPGLINKLAGDDIQASEFGLWDVLVTETTFKFGTILTARRGTPNNDLRLKRTAITPSDLRAIDIEIPDGKGPTQEIRVREGIMTAKYRWPDDNVLGDGVKRRLIDDEEMNRELLVNPLHVKNVALAAAASNYLRYRDRYESRGSVRVDLQPEMIIEGGITSIRHEYTTDGGAYTYFDIPPLELKPRLERFLPDNTRQWILELIQR